MEDFEYLVAKELNEKIGVGSFFHPKYFDHPINIKNQISRMKTKQSLLVDFLTIVTNVSQQALINRDKQLTNILFSEHPVGMDIKYHLSLPESCWKIPILYRTDESLSGKIYELQPPGSGWGDLYLFATCYRNLGFSIPSSLVDFSDVYYKNISKATNKKLPKVFHMTDATSVPYSIRYLMAITNQIQYWGINENVTMNDIDCLISHSVTSTVASNYFFEYLKKSSNGNMIFAISPNIIFDEKAIYLLPFFRTTKNMFSDAIRDLFPFTTLIENNGFYDEENNFINVEDFSKRKPSERKYFLKYGGPDTNRNWGSRSVYRLSSNDCSKLLEMASFLSQKGEIWLIQKDVSNETNCILSDDITDLIYKKKLHIKLSAYYGSDGFMGAKIMGRQHFKVHGQQDSYVGLGV